MEDNNKWLYSSKVSGTGGFTMSTSAVLVGLDAEKYIPIFKNYNMGLSDLGELTDEDLILLGVDSETARNRMLAMFKNVKKVNTSSSGDPSDHMSEVTDMLSSGCRHMSAIRISLMANKVRLKKELRQRLDVDRLVTPDCYAGALALKALLQLDGLLQQEQAELKDFYTNESDKKKKAKSRNSRWVLLGTGTATVLLGICFLHSLKSFKY